MWTALGHSEGAIFVPVWLHGVEADAACQVPEHLTQASGACVYTPARGLITSGADEAELQARTLPVEDHFFDVVTDPVAARPGAPATGRTLPWSQRSVQR